MKRVVDVVAGVTGALLTLPFVLLAAVVLAVELRAWPFFTQTRVGRHGRSMRLVKLRTLPPCTPTDADKYDLAVVRLTPAASLLRRTHLDELPQLWMVALGSMSLVGPRPEMPRLHERFDAEHREARAQVRPGCTGLWQVSVASSKLIHEHPEYDLAYVQARSLALDGWILWRTALILLGGRPTVTLAEAPVRRAVPDPVISLEVASEPTRTA